MKRAKYIFRAVFFLLAVILLVYINKKTNDKVETIAEFKFKMIEKLRTDSLDSKQKLDLLLNDTAKFVDVSSRVKKGIHYLMGLLGVLVTTEFVFLILEKRNPGRQEI